MKKVSFVVTILFLTAFTGFAQQSALEGTLTDKGTGEPMLFANVLLSQNGVFVFGANTDLDGNYEFKDVPAGVYDLELQYVGYQEKRIEGVVIPEGKVIHLNLTMEEAVVCCCCYIPYNPPLINMDEFGSTTTFRVDNRGQIRQ